MDNKQIGLHTVIMASRQYCLLFKLGLHQFVKNHATKKKTNQRYFTNIITVTEELQHVLVGKSGIAIAKFHITYRYLSGM